MESKGRNKPGTFDFLRKSGLFLNGFISGRRVQKKLCARNFSSS